jgi:predicted RNA-binding Zn-ribbon protein involved in translation (DUF1610 family)
MQTSLSNKLPIPTSGQILECPKCSKHSIVRRSPNTFDCLNCNFHKELPPVTISAATPKKLTYSQPPTVRPSLSDLDDFSGADQAQPLLFAVIAVIIGIIVL